MQCKDLHVRLNYEITENGNDYGDDVSRISGVNSPSSPREIIYTRTVEYKTVPKLKASMDEAFDVSGGIAAPRSSVNNCTRELLQDEKNRYRRRLLMTVLAILKMFRHRKVKLLRLTSKN